jgi:hypothetical protein
VLLLLSPTDPLRLLRTKEVRNVKAAIGMLCARKRSLHICCCFCCRCCCCHQQILYASCILRKCALSRQQLACFVHAKEAHTSAAAAAVTSRPSMPPAHQGSTQCQGSNQHALCTHKKLTPLLLLLPLLLLPLLLLSPTDPLRLLRTKEVRNVKAAIGMLVNSAKILSTLTAARALYECNNGADAQLSNELFHQWTQSLVDSTTMHSAGAAGHSPFTKSLKVHWFCNRFFVF